MFVDLQKGLVINRPMSSLRVGSLGIPLLVGGLDGFTEAVENNQTDGTLRQAL